jgi:hypothetical protein
MIMVILSDTYHSAHRVLSAEKYDVKSNFAMSDECVTDCRRGSQRGAVAAFPIADFHRPLISFIEIRCSTPVILIETTQRQALPRTDD